MYKPSWTSNGTILFSLLFCWSISLSKGFQSPPSRVGWRVAQTRVPTFLSSQKEQKPPVKGGKSDVAESTTHEDESIDKTSKVAADGTKTTGKYPHEVMTLPDGTTIAYTQVYKEGAQELIVYLPNLANSRVSNSSSEVENFCVKKGFHFLCADWYSRGDSSGNVMDATLTRWTQDTISLLDKCAPKVEGGNSGNKAILVGEGVGVWVAVLVALKRPDLARGIVGVGGDPDFTDDLLWKELPIDVKEEIIEKGFKEITWGKLNAVYPVTSSLIEDGRRNLVLRGGPKSLPITCPVRLVHSINDPEVPVETSMRLAECMQSPNCVITMPKEGFESKVVNRAIEQCIEFTQGFNANYAG